MLKRVSTWAAVLLALQILFAIHVKAASAVSTSNLLAATNAPVARVQAPSRATGGQHFLTLPFADSHVLVNQGWLYNWGSLHGGTDYVLGGIDTDQGQSFDVVASADGWACGNCTSRQGNAVWIKHVINGQIYYTYYGHLASIEPGIPTGDQKNTAWVHRGQKIGISGSTGASTVHLHFQVNLPSGPVDPYDLWSTREPYMPGCRTCELGGNNLWTTSPPSFASGAQLPSGPAAEINPPIGDMSPTGPATSVTAAIPTSAPLPLSPTATRTPAPTATATPVPCDLPYERTVEGTLGDARAEVRYCLAVTSGDWMAIRMFAVNGASLDTYIKVYTPDGKLFATDDDGAQIGGNSFLVKRAAQTGIYRVVATRYSGSGAYRLRVEKGSKAALGDLNRDCTVNEMDAQLMSAAMGTNDPYADLNLDGVVDAQDQQALQLRLGRGCMLVGR